MNAHGHSYIAMDILTTHREDTSWWSRHARLNGNGNYPSMECASPWISASKGNDLIDEKGSEFLEGGPKWTDKRSSSSRNRILLA